jgi:hypothetical protein
VYDIAISLPQRYAALPFFTINRALVIKSLFSFFSRIKFESADKNPDKNFKECELWHCDREIIVNLKTLKIFQTRNTAMVRLIFRFDWS